MGELLPNSYVEGRRFKEFYENNLLQLGKNVEKISLWIIPFILRRDLFIYKFVENDKSYLDIYRWKRKSKLFADKAYLY